MASEYDRDYYADEGAADIAQRNPEMYFIGQIIGASEFGVGNDGLFVESYLNFGTDWTLLDNEGLSDNIQTHTAYSDDEGFHVFAHPFEYKFGV